MLYLIVFNMGTNYTLIYYLKYKMLRYFFKKKKYLVYINI